jgi:hypothetical protein
MEIQVLANDMDIQVLVNNMEIQRWLFVLLVLMELFTIIL